MTLLIAIAAYIMLAIFIGKLLAYASRHDGTEVAEQRITPFEETLPIPEVVTEEAATLEGATAKAATQKRSSEERVTVTP